MSSYVYGPTCEPCGSAETEPTGHVNVLGMGVDLVRCRGCGLKRYPRAVMSQSAINDGPEAHQLADRIDVMGSMDNMDESKAEEVRGHVRSYYRQLVRQLRAHCGQLDKLHEVGCSCGDFLLAALVEGVSAVSGCEPNARAAEIARRRGLPVEAAFFAGARTPRGRDAVVMLDVLEHTDEPRGDLERARAALRPGGVLLLKTFYDEWHEGRELSLGPRQSAYDIGRTGYFGPDGHLWHFDQPVLRALIERVGLRVVEWSRDAWWGQVTVFARRDS